ncbi:MAG: MltA domain-containing protein, partial [Deltaproteobacteria bacterium]|nr:MltA domain-containing protein [Deltaproteobacteria bacterium]
MMLSLMQVQFAGKRRGLWRLALTAGAVLYCCISVHSARSGEPSVTLPVITDDLDKDSLRTAIAQSKAYLTKLPPSRIIGREPRQFTAGEVMATLQAFEGLLKNWECRDCWVKAIGERFDFIPSAGEAGMRSVLITGYYQPVIEGSLAPTAEYKYPIYGIPGDLMVIDAETSSSVSGMSKKSGRLKGDEFVPYYSRAEIDLQGALRGRGHEIAWGKDPVDIFFMHIQG